MAPTPENHAGRIARAPRHTTTLPISRGSGRSWRPVAVSVVAPGRDPAGGVVVAAGGRGPGRGARSSGIRSRVGDPVVGIRSRCPAVSSRCRIPNPSEYRKFTSRIGLPELRYRNCVTGIQIPESDFANRISRIGFRDLSFANRVSGTVLALSGNSLTHHNTHTQKATTK